MKKTLLLITFFAINNFAYSQKDKVDFAIKNLMEKNKIVGLQLSVIKNNQIVKTSSYGFSNIQDNIKVDNQTLFPINSITKVFTGVAIMQLVESGKLNLEEPISKYLDSLPKTWQNITIKQIATHISGIPDVLDNDGNLITENDEISLKKIKELPVDFNAGEEFRYNQTNYLLLGKVIEKISGKSFEKFISENQFERAEMKNSAKTGLVDFFDIVKHSVRGYSYFRNGKLTNVYEPIPISLRPAGGISSTATEIAKWIIALQNHKLINEQNLKALWTPTTLNNGKTIGMNNFLNGYSIGFNMVLRDEKPIVGSMGGVRSAFFIYPKNNISIVILTNLQGSHPENFIEEIANLYINDK
ncbi:serine hydrolase domain-containing protein [Flavobacterium frigidarium]|uniref:serine hydrolase domain-containing protein n=1 Tax=Flavobacterium frigidarium TaxID=99286 RepID=UPI0030DD460B|tara:strand:- start:2429 stop:3499 length:1071 start_codon:yes stop_codon:yes gene_type:complete